MILPSVCLSVCLSVCDAVHYGYWLSIHRAAKMSDQVNRKCPLKQDFTTFNFLHQPYSLKLPTPNIGNYLFITSRFLDRVTILFMLLQTCESIPVDVVINYCVLHCTIDYLSNSWASWFRIFCVIFYYFICTDSADGEWKREKQKTRKL